MPSADGLTDDMKSIISEMKSDDITFVASRDEVIMKVAEKMLQSKRHKSSGRKYVKDKIREMSRFLKAAREHSSQITGMESCIDPAKFPTIISITRKLCEYNAADNTYKIPSLALKIGHKKCANAVRVKALMTGDDEQNKASESFEKLCDSDWSAYVSNAALTTLHVQKRKKTHALPLTEDIRRVTSHLAQQRKICLEELKSNPTVASWHNLAKTSLANIILFNRRRSGEASRILLKDYEQAKKVKAPPRDDILQSLSNLETKLVSTVMRVEIEGKPGRTVPVLLTEEMSQEIDELVKMRSQVGVVEANPYIFSRPHFASEDHMAGHVHLREAAIDSGMKDPHSLTSTRLRKHIATVSQILNMKDNELEQLCTFMGHDISVHREFYRLPDDTLQLAKVSRLLIAMEQGKVSSFKGKSLNDIEVDFDIVADESADLPVDDEEENDIEDLDIIEADSTSQQMSSKQLPGKKAMKHVHDFECSDDADAPPKKKTSRDHLTSEQTEAVKTYFSKHIDTRNVPGKEECEKFLAKESLLAHKSWKKIKFTVKNAIAKEARRMNNRQKKK